MRIACLAVFFVMISLLGVPAWTGRVIAVSLFAASATTGIFWFGLSSKSKMIRAGGKFNEPQFDKVRSQIEKGIRILVVAFGVFFTFYVTFPIGGDVIHLVGGEKPITVTAVVENNSIPLFGLWFVHQTVRFQRGGESYSLFFSWDHLRVGTSYEFVVFPRSKEILDFHESGDQK